MNRAMGPGTVTKQRILCVSDAAGRRAAQVALISGAPVCTGATEGFLGSVEGALADLLRRGAAVREERIAGGRIGVTFVPVGPDDPLYLEAVADEFRGLGYSARVLDPLRAKAWRLLLAAPMDEDIRSALLAGLGGMTYEESGNLLDELEAAERELSAVDEDARRESDRIAAFEESMMDDFAGKER